MHVASLNTAALERLRSEMPDGDVHTEDGGTDANGEGDATGVVVEEAVDVVWEAVRPDRERMTTLVKAAQTRANELGVTCVHDMVRQSAAPAVYRALDRRDELTLRVRLNYWSDHIDAVDEVGLRTNHGSDMVRTGAIKTFTDGSIGGRTAKLSEPYADAESDDDTADDRGQWVVDPAELREIVERAEELDMQVTAHAIGDEAIAETLAAFEELGGGDTASQDGEGGESRHRIEHAEVLTDDLVGRLGASDVVVSAQPNFLKWAREDGLYAARLGDERRLDSNRFADLLAAGADLAFGSDCMPLDPLFGVQQAVTAPAEGQRLAVTEALRAYTRGGAYAGFDEQRLGTVEPGKRADLVVLERSPWDVDPGEIADIDVALTLVDGEVVVDGRT
jgi:predicted amidohydrolase YtcJ